MIELRHLKCFMAIARERTITRAAESLYISQPALSRTLQELEEELGQPLVIRGKPLSLTPKGELFLKRAATLLEYFDHMCTEISAPAAELSGTITLAAGESQAVDFLASSFFSLKKRHPGINFSLVSGNEDTVSDALNSGMCDFGVYIGSPHSQEYDHLLLPHFDTWGLLVPQEHPLAVKKAVTPADLEGLELIISTQAWRNNEFTGWLGRSRHKVQICGSYNLPYNGFIFAKNSHTCMLSLNGLMHLHPDDSMIFIPLVPEIRVDTCLCWHSSVYSSPLAAAYIAEVKARLNAEVNAALHEIKMP